MANPYSLLDMVWPMGLTSVLHVLILEQSLHSVGDLDKKKEEEERGKKKLKWRYVCMYYTLVLDYDNNMCNIMILAL